MKGLLRSLKRKRDCPIQAEPRHCNDIQACIDSAVAGDTVCVNPGIYDTIIQQPLGDSDPPELVRTTFSVHKDSIVVRGIAGPGYTIVGKDTTAPHVCVLLEDRASGTDGASMQNVVIDGFTFSHGYTDAFFGGQAYGAGGMFCAGDVTGSVIIRNNKFSQNRGRHGGGMRVHGEPVITKNIFINNALARHAGGTGPRGGAILVAAPGRHPIIEGNSFIDNGCLAADTIRGPGGGIFLESGELTIRKNVFCGNGATKGGAINVGVSEDVRIEFNVFERCTADVYGGAIALEATSGQTVGIAVRNNTFYGNSAPEGSGGAIYSGRPDSGLSIVRNIVDCSVGDGVVVEEEGAALDSFGCNLFFANAEADLVGVSGDEYSDTILVGIQPAFCYANPCTLYALHESSACVPGSACSNLMGAIGQCDDCADTIVTCNKPSPTSTPLIASAERSNTVNVLWAAPNPTYGGISIRYDNIQRIQAAELRVYDVAGRLVWRRAVRDVSPGAHLYDWDGVGQNGRSVPSGIYFVQVRGGQERSITKKILVLR